jgi:hypothetical protein
VPKKLRVPMPDVWSDEKLDLSKELEESIAGALKRDEETFKDIYLGSTTTGITSTGSEVMTVEKMRAAIRETEKKVADPPPEREKVRWDDTFIPDPNKFVGLHVGAYLLDMNNVGYAIRVSSVEFQPMRVMGKGEITMALVTTTRHDLYQANDGTLRGVNDQTKSSSYYTLHIDEDAYQKNYVPLPSQVPFIQASNEAKLNTYNKKLRAARKLELEEAAKADKPSATSDDMGSW